MIEGFNHVGTDHKCNVCQCDFTDDEGGVWLSVQTRCGGAHCVIPEAQIPAMIEALKAALKEQA